MQQDDQYLSNLIPFHEAREGFVTGTLSPREYLEQCIEAIEAKDATIHAMVHKDFERARKLSDEATRRYSRSGPLSRIDGLPLGVKDIIDVKGMPTGMNCDLYRDYLPKASAACIQAAIRGGAVPIGKVATTELAISRPGATVNPHNTQRTPGGSSSGSAAGVAAGMFPIALGSQTLGSTIRPASFCGVVGYKPTHDRLSLQGVHPVATSHDHLGILASDVEDVWDLQNWLFSWAPTLRGSGLDVGSWRKFVMRTPKCVAVARTGGYGELDADSHVAFDMLLSRLRRAGVTVVEPDDDDFLARVCQKFDDVPELSLDMVAHDMRWPYGDYLLNCGHVLGPRIHEMVKRGAEVSRKSYQDHLRWRRDLLAEYVSLSETYDAVVLPAASGPAPMGLASTGSRTLLVYATFLGVPAFSLPLMTVDRMPLGLQVMGFPDRDRILSCYAAGLQSILNRF